jgi:hypothetical protein
MHVNELLMVHDPQGFSSHFLDSSEDEAMSASAAAASHAVGMFFVAGGLASIGWGIASAGNSIGCGTKDGAAALGRGLEGGPVHFGRGGPVTGDRLQASPANHKIDW